MMKFSQKKFYLRVTFTKVSRATNRGGMPFPPQGMKCQNDAKNAGLREKNKADLCDDFSFELNTLKTESEKKMKKMLADLEANRKTDAQMKAETVKLKNKMDSRVKQNKEKLQKRFEGLKASFEIQSFKVKNE